MRLPIRFALAMEIARLAGEAFVLDRVAKLRAIDEPGGLSHRLEPVDFEVTDFYLFDAIKAFFFDLGNSPKFKKSLSYGLSWRLRARGANKECFTYSDNILADQNFVAIPADQVHWQPGKNFALASPTNIFEKSTLTCGGAELSCSRVEWVIVVIVCCPYQKILSAFGRLKNITRCPGLFLSKD